MSIFRRQQKTNHHFPELNKTKKIWSIMKKFLRPVQVSVLVVSLVLGFSFAYLSQTNASATKGYKIRELKQSVDALKEQNKQLNLKYIEMQSMAKVVKGSADSDLVPIGEVEVISSLGSSVALVK